MSVTIYLRLFLSKVRDREFFITMSPTTRVTKGQVTHLVPGVRCQVPGARKEEGASLEVKNGGSAVVEH